MNTTEFIYVTTSLIGVCLAPIFLSWSVMSLMLVFKRHRIDFLFLSILFSVLATIFVFITPLTNIIIGSIVEEYNIAKLRNKCIGHPPTDIIIHLGKPNAKWKDHNASYLSYHNISPWYMYLKSDLLVCIENDKIVSILSTD